MFQLCRCCVKIKYLSVFVFEQTETHSKHLNGKPIENDCFFPNPNERTELNSNEHTEANVCLKIFAYLLDR